MSIRRLLPGLFLGLVILLIAGGLLYWRGYRLMQKSVTLPLHFHPVEMEL